MKESNPIPTKVDLSTNDESEVPVIDTPEIQPSDDATDAAAGVAEEETEKKPVGWAAFLKTAAPQDIRERLSKEIGELLTRHGMDKACCLALLEPHDYIDTYDLDQIFSALNGTNADHTKDVVLFLLSTGGAGEPAYQISKLCKSFCIQEIRRGGTALREVRSNLACNWRR